MIGNNHLILQPRDLHLLREVAEMRVLDREQAKIVAGFGSTTRANTRLLALVRAGLLRRFFLGTGGGGSADSAATIERVFQHACSTCHGFRRFRSGALLR